MNKQLFDLSEKLQEKLNWDGPEVDRYLRLDNTTTQEFYIVSRAATDELTELPEGSKVVRLYEKDFLIHKLPAETRDDYVITLEQISETKWAASYAKGDRKVYLQTGETAEEVLIKLALALHKAGKL